MAMRKGAGVESVKRASICNGQRRFNPHGRAVNPRDRSGRPGNAPLTGAKRRDDEGIIARRQPPRGRFACEIGVARQFGWQRAGEPIPAQRVGRGRAGEGNR